MDKLSTEKRGWLMSRVKSKNTIPELTVRRLIFHMGYRYRLHVKNLPGRPDIVFIGRKKVIFVNGCFWHGHFGCKYAHLPKSNTDFWQTKISRNQTRDETNINLLAARGWKVLTVWQCELKNIEPLANRLYEFIEHD